MHLRFSCPHTFLQLCCARSFDGTGNRHRSYTWVLVQALHLTHFDFYLWIFSSYLLSPLATLNCTLDFSTWLCTSSPNTTLSVWGSIMICDQCLVVLLITFYVNLKTLILFTTFSHNVIMFCIISYLKVTIDIFHVLHFSSH